MAARAIRARNVDGENLRAANGVVLVAPVWFGRHARSIDDLGIEHGFELARKSLMFVSVDLAGASVDPIVRARATNKAERFLLELGLRADVVSVVGGTLSYPAYGLLTRLAKRLAASREGLPTDTSRTHTLTDWNALDRDVSRFASGIRAHVDEVVAPNLRPSSS